jgi:biotin transport system substrate-specific component
MQSIISVWNGGWKKYFEKVCAMSMVQKISVSVLFALVTGISAQFYIKLPFTPVPVTSQVMVVLLAGVLLGKKYGTLSQLVYLIFGFSGIGWFAFSGWGILRPTTGYIVGFIIAAFIIGKITEENKSNLKLFAAMFCGIAVIYIAGILWLSLFLNFSLKKAFLLGALPFIPFDIVKAFIAGIITKSIIKNRSGYEKI